MPSLWLATAAVCIRQRKAFQHLRLMAGHRLPRLVATKVSLKFIFAENPRLPLRLSMYTLHQCRLITGHLFSIVITFNAGITFGNKPTPVKMGFNGGSHYGTSSKPFIPKSKYPDHSYTSGSSSGNSGTSHYSGSLSNHYSGPGSSSSPYAISSAVKDESKSLMAFKKN